MLNFSDIVFKNLMWVPPVHCMPNVEHILRENEEIIIGAYCDKFHLLCFTNQRVMYYELEEFTGFISDITFFEYSDAISCTSGIYPANGRGCAVKIQTPEKFIIFEFTDLIETEEICKEVRCCIVE